MSFKLLKMQIFAIAAGLAVVTAGVAVFGAAGPVQAAAISSIDCLKPSSLKDQAACHEEERTAETGFGTVVTWLLPSAEEKIGQENQSGVIGAGKSIHADNGLRADGLSSTGLLLFGAALVGIVYLGRRRRKPQVRENQADISR